MKNKIIILIGIILSFGAYAETDYIDMQIMELEQRRDALKSELAACEKNTKGYKIAGISTLAATGVGVYGNIRLAQEIQKVKESKSGGTIYAGGGAGVLHGDNLTTEQKINRECEYDFPCEDLCEFHYECSQCECPETN